VTVVNKRKMPSVVKKLIVFAVVKAVKKKETVPIATAV